MDNKSAEVVLPGSTSTDGPRRFNVMYCLLSASLGVYGSFLSVFCIFLAALALYRPHVPESRTRVRRRPRTVSSSSRRRVSNTSSSQKSSRGSKGDSKRITFTLPYGRDGRSRSEPSLVRTSKAASSDSDSSGSITPTPSRPQVSKHRSPPPPSSPSVLRRGATTPNVSLPSPSQMFADMKKHRPAKLVKRPPPIVHSASFPIVAAAEKPLSVVTASAIEGLGIAAHSLADGQTRADRSPTKESPGRAKLRKARKGTAPSLNLFRLKRSSTIAEVGLSSLGGWNTAPPPYTPVPASPSSILQRSSAWADHVNSGRAPAPAPVSPKSLVSPSPPPSPRRSMWRLARSGTIA